MRSSRGWNVVLEGDSVKVNISVAVLGTRGRYFKQKFHSARYVPFAFKSPENDSRGTLRNDMLKKEGKIQKHGCEAREMSQNSRLRRTSRGCNQFHRISLRGLVFHSPTVSGEIYKMTRVRYSLFFRSLLPHDTSKARGASAGGGKLG